MILKLDINDDDEFYFVVLYSALILKDSLHKGDLYAIKHSI